MNTIVKDTIRSNLSRTIVGLLLFFSGVSVSGAQATDRLPGASTQAIVSEASLNSAAARKSQSDPPDCRRPLPRSGRWRAPGDEQFVVSGREK
jgi:hypothetical protein